MPFTVGQVVDFNPSPVDTGWIITAQDGTELALVPTAEAARHSSTEQW